MGLPSVQQIRSAKEQAKGGRHGRILAKKRMKNQKQIKRRKKKQETESAPERTGRAEMKGASSDRAASGDGSMDTSMRRVRESSVPIKAGTGSGSVGSRYASKMLKPAVRVSKRGGRRRKPTLRAFGHR
eukprot:gnl/TRDRNA2_/TRDRNA2_135287_c0_seq3.p1 gnl/TRDRNA2_/TRDRNA2_135287_c0~~gnl/TRDRNA2_/TRDRNA2_135287_c0_seq3.p1  ORF type:complete len:129 (+),score=23.66 gnl/TRDRNA2_/TRDRNA2_135287_c0_seq3:103-489(+)